VLPAGVSARVNRASWRVPPIFRWIGEAGRVPEYDLRRALNMGVGMIVVVAAKDVDEARRSLLEAGEANSVVIGEIVAGGSGVEYA
jgi:phosphoribosylaminoimidazole (AIR) synthetase